MQDRQKQLGSIEGKLRDAEDLLSRHEQQISGTFCSFLFRQLSIVALMQRLTESGKSDKPFQALLADAEKQVEKSKQYVP